MDPSALQALMELQDALMILSVEFEWLHLLRILIGGASCWIHMTLALTSLLLLRALGNFIVLPALWCRLSHVTVHINNLVSFPGAYDRKTSPWPCKTFLMKKYYFLVLLHPLLRVLILSIMKEGKYVAYNSLKPPKMIWETLDGELIFSWIWNKLVSTMH